MPIKVVNVPTSTLVRISVLSGKFRHPLGFPHPLLLSHLDVRQATLAWHNAQSTESRRPAVRTAGLLCRECLTAPSQQFSKDLLAPNVDPYFSNK
jgi:hypothetical protein